MSKKSEQAVIKAAMRRYREWAKDYPVMHDRIIARELTEASNAAAACIRACAAHAKSLKGKPK